MWRKSSLELRAGLIASRLAGVDFEAGFFVDMWITSRDPDGPIAGTIARRSDVR